MILTPLQEMPNNVGNLGKIIVATGFEWLSKVQKIAKSGHTDCKYSLFQRQVDAHGFTYAGLAKESEISS